jgi:hypothetical protein
LFASLIRHTFGLMARNALIGEGIFSDVHDFLRYIAKNREHPLKVLLPTMERSDFRIKPKA